LFTLTVEPKLQDLLTSVPEDLFGLLIALLRKSSRDYALCEFSDGRELQLVEIDHDVAQLFDEAAALVGFTIDAIDELLA